MMKNDESKSFSVRGVIVHKKKDVRTVIMVTTKRYMHLWHKFLIIMTLLVEIFVTVPN